MPWPTLQQVPANLRKHKKVPLTLAQANYWGRVFDETGSAAIAWKQFNRRYIIRGGRWLLRSRKIGDSSRVDAVRHPRRPRKMLFPKGAELDYYRQLRAIVIELQRIANEVIIPALPSIISRSKMLRPDSDQSRIDDYAEDIDEKIGLAEAEFATAYPATKVGVAVTAAGTQISRFNRTQVTLVAKSLLKGINRRKFPLAPVDVFISEPWLAAEMASFTRENVKLIQSLSTDYFDKLEGTIQRGVRGGLRHEEIADQIRATTKTTRNRAALIARDQTNKFNGQLTMRRQESIGIEKYIWRTAGDNRVRDEHADREGETFSWNNPPAGGHPGQEINCRCIAEPVIPDQWLLQEAA